MADDRDGITLLDARLRVLDAAEATLGVYRVERSTDLVFRSPR